MIQQMQFGGIDFSRVSLSQLAEYEPALSVLQLPYLYTDADQMWRCLLYTSAYTLLYTTFTGFAPRSVIISLIMSDSCTRMVSCLLYTSWAKKSGKQNKEPAKRCVL